MFQTNETKKTTTTTKTRTNLADDSLFFIRLMIAQKPIARLITDDKKHSVLIQLVATVVLVFCFFIRVQFGRRQKQAKRQREK